MAVIILLLARRVALIVLLLPVLIVSTLLQAQPDSLWSMTFGGPGKDDILSLAASGDEGFVFTGSMTCEGSDNLDLVIARIDSSGNLVWSRTYGGARDDRGYSVQQTSDGGYIVAGGTRSFGVTEDYDFWMIKTDSEGLWEWSQTFGSNSDDIALSVRQATDGGFFLAGYTETQPINVFLDAMVVKTDSLGCFEWDLTCGEEYSTDVAYSVLETPDGGCVFTGKFYEMYPDAPGEMFLIKADSLGSIEWERTYTKADYSCGNSVCHSQQGGYMIAGYTVESGSDRDAWIVRTNQSGDYLWSRLLGGQGEDSFLSVIQMTSGCYSFAGYSESYGDDRDLWVLSISSNGNFNWSGTYGGNGTDIGCALLETPEGNHLIAGYTDSFGAGGWDGWLIKLESGLFIDDFPGQGVSLRCMPNPSSGPVTLSIDIPEYGNVRLTMHDLAGRLVSVIANSAMASGRHEINPASTPVVPGIYLLTLEHLGCQVTEKLVVLP